MASRWNLDLAPGGLWGPRQGNNMTVPARPLFSEPAPIVLVVGGALAAALLVVLIRR